MMIIHKWWIVPESLTRVSLIWLGVFSSTFCMHALVFQGSSGTKINMGTLGVEIIIRGSWGKNWWQKSPLPTTYTATVSRIDWIRIVFYVFGVICKSATRLRRNAGVVRVIHRPASVFNSSITARVDVVHPERPGETCACAKKRSVSFRPAVASFFVCVPPPPLVPWPLFCPSEPLGYFFA